MLTDFLCHTQPSVATTTYFDVYYYFNLKHVRAMFCEVLILHKTLHGHVSDYMAPFGIRN